MEMKKYTVLSYIFGNYECLHEVLEPDPEADYIMVTDRTDLRSDTWRIVLDERKGMSIMEQCYDVRFHPFRYAETELCLRLDGSIAIHKSLRPFIDKMDKGRYDRCLMIHPFRNSIYEEYMRWTKKCGGYPVEQAQRSIDTLKHLGYPQNYRGLFQASFEVVRNNRMNEDINSLTHTLMRHVSIDGTIDRVDQTMLSFVINHLYADRLKVLPVSQDIITDGRLMQWCRHNSNTPRKWRVKVPPMMFDKPCEVWQ